MQDNFVALLTMLPFGLWYLYRHLQLRALQTSGVRAQSVVLQKLLNTIMFEYSDANGKTHRKQLRLPRKLARQAQKGDTMDVLYNPQNPRFSCPAVAVDATFRINRRMMYFTLFLIGFFVLGTILSLTDVSVPAGGIG